MTHTIIHPISQYAWVSTCNWISPLTHGTPIGTCWGKKNKCTNHNVTLKHVVDLSVFLTLFSRK